MLMEITSRLTALLLIVALLPLFVIIALVSLVIQGLPIIFTQPRVGRNFKKLYKKVMSHSLWRKKRKNSDHN